MDGEVKTQRQDKPQKPTTTSMKAKNDSSRYNSIKFFGLPLELPDLIPVTLYTWRDLRPNTDAFIRPGCDAVEEVPLENFTSSMNTRTTRVFGLKSRRCIL
jgi:hypothetical protein